jgi:hypothetical protein
MKRGEEKGKEGSGSVGVLLVEVGSLCSKLGSLMRAMVLGAATNCYVLVSTSHIKG